MGGGRAAGREVWVRVEDGRGGDGKLVLLARPGLSNAVGGRGNVGTAPARQGQSAIHPAAVKYAIDVICWNQSPPLAQTIAITCQNCFE